jgi:hypothetical protein
MSENNQDKEPKKGLSWPDVAIVFIICAMIVAICALGKGWEW